MVNLTESSLYRQGVNTALAVLAILTGPLLTIIHQHFMRPYFNGLERFDILSDSVLDPISETNKAYDFIIVGAGSSGCSLAHFLAKDFSVLLLEAGGDIGDNIVAHLPIIAYPNMDQRALIYPYKTVPQKSASFGCRNNMTAWPAGRGIGGSSNVNGLIYIRGNNIGYNEIAQRVGDSRWELKNILTIFREIEDYRGRFDENNHGSGGGMSIEGGYSSPYIKTFLKAGVEFKMPVRDPNHGPLAEGVSPADFYLKRGKRWNANDGFIKPNLNNPNLTVIKYAHVTKVILKNLTAYGVHYERHGSENVVYANNEVILSAGAIGTPKILMLSGIGDKEHLESLRVKVKINLPVGNHLQDKFGAIIGPFYMDRGYSFATSRDASLPNFLKWLWKGTGPLASSKTEGTFSKSSLISKAEGTANNPDLHSYILSFSPDSDLRYSLKSAFNFNEKALDHFTNVEERDRDSDAFYQLVCVSAPRGSGTLRLVDTNPKNHPLLDPKYLQNDRDVKVLTEGIRWAVDLVENTESFREINARYKSIPHPDCKMHGFKSDKYYECLARHTTMTAFKYGGTVPVGPRFGDDEACVDSHFRIIGARRLRVIDGSVLQEKYVSVNDVVCRMLGKLGADIIKSDWKI